MRYRPEDHERHGLRFYKTRWGDSVLLKRRGVRHPGTNYCKLHDLFTGKPIRGLLVRKDDLIAGLD